MIKLAQFLRKGVADPLAKTKWRYMKNLRESVYFYTFHKCASSLFSGYVLKNIEGLRHVDYAKQIYTSGKVDSLTFDRTGHVYGPIRLSIDPVLPIQKKFLELLSDDEFIQDRISIFMVRDPRDIIVSAYYSFGFTHGKSPVQEIRERQEQRRSEIQNKTVDEFALASVHQIQSDFETADRLRKICTRSVVLRYEDMVGNWGLFASDLTRYLTINQTVLSQLYERSRPREKEDVTSHRRSGQVAGFRGKLEEETITSLNNTLKDVLQQFQYDV
jgi:hypothetical protein